MTGDVRLFFFFSLLVFSQTEADGDGDRQDCPSSMPVSFVLSR